MGRESRWTIRVVCTEKKLPDSCTILQMGFHGHRKSVIVDSYWQGRTDIDLRPNPTELGEQALVRDAAVKEWSARIPAASSFSSDKLMQSVCLFIWHKAPYNLVSQHVARMGHYTARDISQIRQAGAAISDLQVQKYNSTGCKRLVIQAIIRRLNGSKLHKSRKGMALQTCSFWFWQEDKKSITSTIVKLSEMKEVL